jgi:TetR/AcrR family transcriptional regulator, transcriptional repressor for nem operon
VTTAPSTDRGRSSCARIVQAASGLFYRQGVARTGLSEVAAASGTGKGQLYHYFLDKADLVLAVVNAQVDRTLEAQQAALEQMNDANDLRAWVDAAVAAHQHGRPARCPLGALVSEVADTDDVVRHALDVGFTRWRTALAHGIARLQRNGCVHPNHDPQDAAEILLCAYEGGVLISEVRGDTRPLRLALSAVLDSLLT